MEGKAIAITSWICVTLIILLVLWITQLEIDFFGLIIFIVILYAMPFILSIYVLEKEWNIHYRYQRSSNRLWKNSLNWVYSLEESSRRLLLLSLFFMWKVRGNDKTESDQTLEVHKLCYYTLDSKHCICNYQLRRIGYLFYNFLLQFFF